MTLPLNIEPEAELDLKQAYRWYEGQLPGPRREFLQRVEDVFQRIARSPERHAVSYRNVRQTLVRRFP